MKSRFGIVSMVVMILLMTSAFAGFNTINIQENQTKDVNTLSFDYIFPEPLINEDEEWVMLDAGSDFISYSVEEGFPELPYKNEVIVLPFGTKIVSVEFTPSNSNTKTMAKKILPAAAPNRLDMTYEFSVRKTGEIYDENQLYPESWMNYHVGVGRNGYEQAMFLTLQLFPYRYNSANDEVTYIDSMNIDIQYERLTTLTTNNDEYDIVIITPADFSANLQPLVSHKESYGLSTKLITLDEIYGGTYFSAVGRDDAEKIKYFIKDAMEQWGIDYVLLVGGRNKGFSGEQWWCPVRYAYLDDNSDEDHYLSDLYFSDIYKYENNDTVFDDWDSNGNGYYAEWSFRGKDIIDMYADVFVGRLACRNTYEVDVMVEKIITYETTAYTGSWSKRFIGVAGDTYPDSGDLSYIEGELANEAAFNYLTGYTSDYLWTSTGALADADDIINSLNQGAGFLHFSGHGNPMSWATHPPQDHETWIGIDEFQFMQFDNNGMYPVCIVGGCHNSQFNISLLNLLKFSNLETIYYKSLWGPESWGWWLTRKVNGGTIATIANSGYGYGQPGEECLERRGRYMELQFFKSFSEGIDMLGATHAQGNTYYLNKFPPLSDRVDTKIVEQWVLLGDPSLKIGGYP